MKLLNWFKQWNELELTKLFVCVGIIMMLIVYVINYFQYGLVYHWGIFFSDISVFFLMGFIADLFIEHDNRKNDK